MPKSGGDKNMAKKQDLSALSDVDKLKHYSERMCDPNLSGRQRGWARMRVTQLSKKLSQPSPARSSGQTTLPATQGQNNAFNAGIGFGAAKAGKRVPVKLENQPAFRDGVKVGRKLAKK